MESAALEFHDSKGMGARRVGADVVLELDAYVHVSDGVPGVDAGTGWTQPIRITVRNAKVEALVDELLIYDGHARVDDRVFDDMLPTDLDLVGATDVRCSGAEGTISVSGSGLRVEALGERTYVERFPPNW